MLYGLMPAAVLRVRLLRLLRGSRSAVAVSTLGLRNCTPTDAGLCGEVSEVEWQDVEGWRSRARWSGPFA